MVDPLLERTIQALLDSGKSVDDIHRHLLLAFPHPHSSEDSQKHTIQTVATIGAVLVGCGVFSFIASNWQVISPVMKVTLILVFMITAYLSGWIIKEKYHYAKTGDALILLGSLIYGGGIFLVGQIFNLRANWPDGFILWMWGTLLMGFTLKHLALMSLGLVVGLIAIVGHPFIIFTSLGFNTILFTSTGLLALSTLCTFMIAHRYRQQILPTLKEDNH